MEVVLVCAHGVHDTCCAVRGRPVAAARTPDAILLDLRLPDLSGLEVYRRLRQIDARIPVIFITATSDADSAIDPCRRKTGKARACR